MLGSCTLSHEDPLLLPLIGGLTKRKTGVLVMIGIHDDAFNGSLRAPSSS